MDQRIAEEALLAGVDYDLADSSGTLDAQGALEASSGSVLAPGAAEGLASAPVQQQQQQRQQQPGSRGDVDSSQGRLAQSSSSLAGQGGEPPGAEFAGRQPTTSSSQDSRASATQSAAQQARDVERRQEADRLNQSSSREAVEGSSDDALQDQQSTGLASAQEAYREDGSVENGMHPGHKFSGSVQYQIKVQARRSVQRLTGIVCGSRPLVGCAHWQSTGLSKPRDQL